MVDGPTRTRQGRTVNEWRQIIETHGPDVWRTVCRMVSDMDAARDCYQETFLAAVKHARRQEVANWAALLTTLATRRAIDYLRRRYRTMELPDTGFDADNVPAQQRDIAADMEHAELRQRVRKHLAELPRRQAQAFWMRHVEGQSISQIAAALNTQPGNVSVLINRACKRLREALDRNPAPIRLAR